MASQQQQSTSSSPLVWFQLIDAATWEPYRGTTADYVTPPPGSVIAQFRDAVKTKYDQPGYLKDIPAGALHVYQNMQTLLINFTVSSSLA